MILDVKTTAIKIYEDNIPYSFLLDLKRCVKARPPTFLQLQFYLEKELEIGSYRSLTDSNDQSDHFALSKFQNRNISHMLQLPSNVFVQSQKTRV